MHLVAVFRYAKDVMSGTLGPEKRNDEIPRYKASGHLDPLIERVKQGIRDELDGNVAGSWIYYIRMGDEIKIGVSNDPLRRAQALSLNASHILAIEPGTQLLERKRHAEFRHLRLHGEWFRAEDPLLAHIEQLKVKAA